MIARLREGLPPEGRAIGLGEELPPGRADAVRPLPTRGTTTRSSWPGAWRGSTRSTSRPAPDRTSRSTVTWESAIRGRDRLRESGVGAIVAATPPPAGAFERVEKVGRVWIAWLDARPWAESGSKADRAGLVREPRPGRHPAPMPPRPTASSCARPGTRAGRPGSTAGRWPIEPGPGPFLTVPVTEGRASK